MKKLLIIFLTVFIIFSCSDKKENKTDDSSSFPEFKIDQDSFVSQVKSITNASAVSFGIHIQKDSNTTNLQLKISQPQTRSDNDNLLRVQGSRLLGICQDQITNLTRYDSLHVVLDKSGKNDFIERNEIITLKFEIKETSSK